MSPPFLSLHQDGRGTLLLAGADRGTNEENATPCAARSIEHLRDLKAFFGTTFKIKDASAPSSGAASSRLALTDGADDDDEAAAIGGKDVEGEEYILSCVGTGFTNTAKRAG